MSHCSSLVIAAHFVACRLRAENAAIAGSCDRRGSVEYNG